MSSSRFLMLAAFAAFSAACVDIPPPTERSSPCDGVVCDTPPGDECVSSDLSTAWTGEPGTCVEGACEYPTKQTTCDFGCQAGHCLTDPCAGVTCDAPPEDHCESDTLVRYTTSGGTCDAGTCSYESEQETCPAGCDGGVCTDPTTCLPSSCNGHGTCDDSQGTVTCDCDNGWSGTHCEQFDECVTVTPTPMVSVPGGYQIDATETTWCQYFMWVESKPPVFDQPPSCSWNDDFKPDQLLPPAGKGEHPVVGVDWCDAYAYCSAAGKRLCGKVGGEANDYGEFNNALTSQWYRACTSGGKNNFPYAGPFKPLACNGEDADKFGTVPVGTMADCQPGLPEYAGIFDLSGNVWEWEDSCAADSGASDMCRLRGGSFAFTSPHLRCDNGGMEYSGERNFSSPSVGFRCCSSP